MSVPVLISDALVELILSHSSFDIAIHLLLLVVVLVLFGTGVVLVLFGTGVVGLGFNGFLEVKD
jgi:hypothetical protein